MPLEGVRIIRARMNARRYISPAMEEPGLTVSTLNVIVLKQAFRCRKTPPRGLSERPEPGNLP